MAEASGEVGRLEPATVAQSFAVPPPGAANFVTALGPQSHKPKGVSGEPRHRACADGRPISELLLSAPREPAGACWKGDSGRDRAVCRDSAKAAWAGGQTTRRRGDAVVVFRRSETHTGVGALSFPWVQRP